MFFDLVIEVLVISIIYGIKIDTREFKLALYADDIVCFLRKPVDSMKVLSDILRDFGEVSGYQVIQRRSILMGVHTTVQLKIQIGLVTKACEKEKKMKYFGILLSKDVKDDVQDNIIPFLKVMDDQFRRWSKLKIS